MSTSINTNFTKEIENNAHKHRQNVYEDFFWVISYNSHGDEKSYESKLYNISDFVDVLNIFLKGLGDKRCWLKWVTLDLLQLLVCKLGLVHMALGSH
jgi:hypothetical protein